MKYSSSRLLKALSEIQKENNFKSRRQIAERMGYSSANYITRLANGKDNISDAFVKRLTAAFPIQVEFLTEESDQCFIDFMNIQTAQQENNKSGIVMTITDQFTTLQKEIVKKLNHIIKLLS